MPVLIQRSPRTKLKSTKANPNREQWLTNCAEAFIPMMETVAGKRMPDFRISASFPTRGGVARVRRVIGQCHPSAFCQNGVNQLFISPLLGSKHPYELSGTVVHEVAHALVGLDEGHNAVFGRAVRPLGLIGKLTATVPGPEFKKLADPILAKLGPYPHLGMRVNAKHKAAPGRLLKAQCPECEFKVRITAVWLDNEEYGPPICPLHHVAMVAETSKGA